MIIETLVFNRKGDWSSNEKVGVLVIDDGECATWQSGQVRGKFVLQVVLDVGQIRQSLG